MELIDSHAHFENEKENRTNGEIVERAIQAGIGKIMAVGGSPEMNATALSLAEKHPGTVYAAVGLSREYCHSANPAETGNIRKMIASEPTLIKAVGETGLDFHYSPESSGAQQKLFQEMLDIALPAKLPVIVHSRNAEEATLSILKSYSDVAGASEKKGVLHCFTGEFKFAKQLVDIGFYISFSGILTFKNAGAIRDAAAKLPENKILIETDSPYLAPEPMRGRRNEPALLKLIAKYLAEIRGCSYNRALEFTSENARNLFGI